MTGRNAVRIPTRGPAWSGCPRAPRPSPAPGSKCLPADTRRATPPLFFHRATEYVVPRVLPRNVGRSRPIARLLGRAVEQGIAAMSTPNLVHAVMQTFRRKLGAGGSQRGLDSETSAARIPHAPHRSRKRSWGRPTEREDG